VGEFESFRDPESYVGGSVATGRDTQAGQVKGMKPGEERHPGPPGWGWAQGQHPRPGKIPIQLKTLNYGKMDG